MESDDNPSPAAGVIVRADEIDEAAVESHELSSSTAAELQSSTDRDADLDDVLETEDASIQSGALAAGTIRSPVRPILRRDASAPPPPPPRQPPPPAPPAQADSLGQPTDSLSLGQLKNIVANFPKLEPVAYAYSYDDTRSFPEELEEWFQYTQEDRDLIEEARLTFEARLWAFDPPRTNHGQPLWLVRSEADHMRFIRGIVDEFYSGDAPTCLGRLNCLAYLAMGVWKETTLKNTEPNQHEEYEFEPPNQKYRRTVAQLNCIRQSASLIVRACALPKLYEVIRHICEHETAYDPSTSDDLVASESAEMATKEDIKTRQLNAALTTLYFLLESGCRQLRNHKDDSIREAVVSLEPSILDYFSSIIAKIRWSEESELPFTKIMLVLWKSTLLVFGDSSVLASCKQALRKDSTKSDNSTLYTSPLDYHVFRQEITSKYPAYNPPPPLIPLEINNNSILPPQPTLNSRTQSQDNIQGLGNGDNNHTSIFNQPVHIATPAPSPPPSPAGPGGKGGKKQNYQTNQNFPFLYPPLDSSSNDLGGKGKAEQQIKLVGKRWEGGDVPASIVEAGQLFASRMRMSRALQQLWDVREEFIRFERGWEQGLEREDGEIPDVDEEFGKLDIESSSIEEGGDGDEAEGKNQNGANTSSERVEPETDDPVTLARMHAVDSYFHILPQLQSMIIVLLKIFLSNVSILGSMNTTANGLPAATEIDDSPEDKPLPRANINLSRQLTTGQPEQEHDSQTFDELNSVRTREVTSKAISGFMLTILKWFRLSHVLKFEYATQLLLDSNYVPLALKYFALQDIDKAVDLKNDRAELDFFNVCHLLSGYPQPHLSASSPPRPPSSSSVESAAPPPIARHRPSPSSSNSSSPPPSPGSPGSPAQRPEVDELGYPTTALPPQPLTTYAPRFFFTYITTLRLLQKLTKGHAHRALLLVQYKSSTILRKALKVPQPSLRLYTLKLFKTQVPFCGRKWRQANMRVITAIYVFCRMGLRDEWISGGGQVEEVVEGAVGTESAWRGLTGWWLARKYRDALVTKNPGPSSAASMEDLMIMIRGGPGSGVFGANCGEDFFARELEKMGWGVGSDVIEDEEGEWGEWDGGPLELDGW